MLQAIRGSAQADEQPKEQCQHPRSQSLSLKHGTLLNLCHYSFLH